MEFVPEIIASIALCVIAIGCILCATTVGK
jgi:hypothetical protein